MKIVKIQILAGFGKTKVTQISSGFPCLIFLLAICLVMLCLGLHPDRLLSLFEFVPWECHSLAGSPLQVELLVRPVM